MNLLYEKDECKMTPDSESKKLEEGGCHLLR